MKLKEYLKDRISALIREKYGVEDAPFDIARPPEGKEGDFAVNAGFVLAKTAKKPSAEIAKELALLIANDQFVEKAEAAGRGYINIFIPNDYYKTEIGRIVKNKDFFANTAGKGRKVNIEFVSANPVGPLNVVSGRAGAYGDTLANLLKMCGYEVHKENYINDHGRQMKLFGESLKARYFELHKKDMEIPEGGYRGEYVKEIARQIDIDDPGKNEQIMEATALNQHSDIDDFFRVYGREYVKNWQKTTLENYGVAFDEWFSEDEMHKRGEVGPAIEIIRGKELTKMEDGAEWFMTTKYGDDKDRVIKKSEGGYTYFASDIAYMKNKLDRGADILVNILGPDHHGYIKRLESIIQALGHEKDKLKVIILQQVNLLEGGEKAKMSKRQGKIVTLDDLIEAVGRDAARYFFVMRNYNSHLDFDMELAKEQSDKNPVYYCQYAYARVCNIFSHAEEKHVYIEDYNGEEFDFSALEPEEKKLIIRMTDMPDVIKEAAEKYAPSVLVQKTYDLVSDFHSFYNKHRVVSDDKKAMIKRLFILRALKITLKTCLGIIGVNAPEKM